MDMPLTERGGIVSAQTSGAESAHSAVSWAAIFGGAVVAAGVTLILVALGAGLGLSAVSPWGGGASATTFTVAAAIWIIVTQWLSAGVGGYLTGRLRTRWVSTHTHEVFFRDTAHGFVVWALATLVTAGLLVSAGASVAGGIARASGVAAATASRGVAGGGGSYDLDVLFRGSSDAGPASGPDVRAEAARIIGNALAGSGDVAQEDRAYLASVVSARTGVSPQEAQARVDTFITRAKLAADNARKGSAATALFTALSMLIGAFIACVAAALGGRERDINATRMPGA